MADSQHPKSFKSKGKEQASKAEGLQNSVKRSSKNKVLKRDSAIPKEVANRMARRIAITTGIPTIAGMAVFIVSYLIVSKGIADIPPALTLLSSAACFLLGLVGLSYGILSASWEESPGGLLGLKNILPNIEKVRDTFKSLLTQQED